MEIHCPHFAICSGCLREKEIENPQTLGLARQFFSQLGIPNFEFHAGSPIRWRSRAKLSVRGMVKNPEIGLYEKGSHNVINIPLCQVHDLAINRAVEVLRTWIIKHEISPYNEQNGQGLLRYIQLAVERSTGKIQLVLVLNQKDPKSNLTDPRLNELWQTENELWHSLWINANTRRDNVIFGTEWLLVKGEAWLWEEICGQKISFHPGSFVQANLEMFEKLLVQLKTFVPDQSRLVEFYAGVGIIGFTLLDRCQKIDCVEIVPMAEKCFDVSRALLPEDKQNRIMFHLGASDKQLHILDQSIDVVVVDPPRKGLDAGLLKLFCQKNSIKRLIYVSCGWEAFKRDCTLLIDNGWKLKNAEGFLFFPGTDQIETLAIFDRD